MQFLFMDGTMEGIYLKHLKTSSKPSDIHSGNGERLELRTVPPVQGDGLESEREMVGMIIMMIHG